MLGICNQQDWQIPITETTSFQPLWDSRIYPSRNRRGISPISAKMDLSLKFWGNNIRLVMKAKSFFLFWMVEHDYCLRWKVPKAKSFKSEKLQANRTALANR